MSKKNIIIISTKNMSDEEWHKRRGDGLGASEAGTVLGLNQYKAPIQLWYEKLQPTFEKQPPNFRTRDGKESENLLTRYWKHWNGTAASIDENMHNRKIVRDCYKPKGIYHNLDYPHLFASPDRIIKRQKGVPEGVLELKKMNSYEGRKWIGDVPQNYLIQVHTQIICSGLTWGELAVHCDGDFNVIPLAERDALQEIIIIRTATFWQSVLEGRKILTQKYEAIRNHNMKLAAELQAQLELLEPSADGSEAYEAFIKEKYRKPLAAIGLIKGTAADLETAKELQVLKQRQKALEIEMRECENKLKRRIAENKAIDMGAEGKITWDGREGKARVLRLQLK